MTECVKLSRVEGLLERLDYPVVRDAAASEFDDVIVQLADGEANLGGLISEVDSDSLDSADELYGELNDVLPSEAVGEPGQSEGDT